MIDFVSIIGIILRKVNFNMNVMMGRSNREATYQRVDEWWDIDRELRMNGPLSSNAEPGCSFCTLQEEWTSVGENGQPPLQA